MNIKDFLAVSVGLHASEYIDKICDNFHINPSDKDVRECLHLGGCINFGNHFVAKVFDEVINNAEYNLNLDRDKFTYCCNGSLDTTLYYDGNAVDSWGGLVEIAESKETE